MPWEVYDKERRAQSVAFDRGLYTRRQAVAQAIPKRESWWSKSSGECFDNINIIIEVERLDKVYLIFHFIRWATSK